MPVRSPEFVDQLGRAYALGTMPARLLAIAFAISTTELSDLVRRHGWQARATGLWAAGKTPSERAAEIRAAEAARALELRGDAIEDVRLLRQRGFVVVREGERCRVGNALCSLAALRAKAARERRLLEADRPSDPGKLGSPTPQFQACPLSASVAWASPTRSISSRSAAPKPSVMSSSTSGSAPGWAFVRSVR